MFYMLLSKELQSWLSDTLVKELDLWDDIQCPLGVPWEYEHAQTLFCLKLFDLH